MPTENSPLNEVLRCGKRVCDWIPGSELPWCSVDATAELRSFRSQYYEAMRNGESYMPEHENQLVFAGSTYGASNEYINPDCDALLASVSMTQAQISFQQLQQQCAAADAMDIVFLVDGSGSVGQENFDTQIEFLKGVTAAMDIGPGENQTRIAFMQYESSTTLEFLFLDDPAALITSLDAVNYSGGGTSTGFAINQAYNQIIVPHKRNNAGAAIIVVTDGASGDDVVGPSNAMRNNGVTMAAVGYAGANINELNAIANDPDSDYVFMGTTSADILEMAAKLTSVICTTESSNRGIFRTLDIQMEGGFRGLGDDGFLEEELF